MPVKLQNANSFLRKAKRETFNYRPISLLPLISKVLERVIHDQTNAFLKGNNLLYNYQSGFRSNHSTNSCLSFLTDKILKDFDESLLTGMIFIDLKKAFDTINHEILFKKLKAMGFSQGCITWFQSYGPILGHLLFLIYVNDMPQAVNSDLFLYADDSCLMFQHKEVEEIERMLNNDFENICDWFVDIKLSIHFGEDKTKPLLFASQHKIKTIKKLSIKYQDIEIKQHSQVTYLGCVMDETISGKPMALKVINKINEKLNFLYRKNSFLTPGLRRMLYNALIQPQFDYACSAWFPNLNAKLKQTANNAK